MRVRNAMIGAMFAAGLVGCVEATDSAEPAESEAIQNTVVQCTNQSWRNNFYSDPAMHNLVGHPMRLLPAAEAFGQHEHAVREAHVQFDLRPAVGGGLGDVALLTVR